MIRFISFMIAILLVVGCKTPKIATEETIFDGGTIEIEERDLDTLVISAEKPNSLKTPEEYQLPVYRGSYKLENDIIHTALDLKFDWAKEHVLGKATLTIKPWFYAVDKITLDAKDFDIHKINYAGQSTPLKYEYDNQRLTILLGKTIKRGEEYKLEIDYTAKPAELGGQGGSAAITSDQGLFFINPKNEDPEKPQQIWTQGETEWNSRWFPTTDKPNERCTQEMYLTVDDKYVTLSNGLLKSSKKNADGTRTDYWKMDMPHAPYLFMIAVGEFAVVKETWENIPLEYYVEPAYKADAKKIFNHTPEMLSFFSKITGVKYPWQKYSQIIVRDYVSGAMENTTGVIFGDFVQKTERELIDNHNDGIVAHEMFHHWFGDYVTCESWANLTMNEGFANYSEYLWFEHKYGREEADRHRRNEMNGYLVSVEQSGTHPLIYWGYDNKEDMFDAHSYNKGGLVLHMLRNLVGDEAFFAGLEKYLKDNALTSVEAHDLRLAFEEVTGQDLKWFFDQWFFASGHPQLKVSYDLQPNQVAVTVEQTQNPDAFPAIFILPFAIDIYTADGKSTRHDVVLENRKQTFNLKTNGQSALVNFDADRILLAEVDETQSAEDYIFQYKNAPLYADKYEALSNLAEVETSAAKTVFAKALTDSFWEIRGLAIRSADKADPVVITKLKSIAQSDVNSKVRAAALSTLGSTGNKAFQPLLEKAAKTEKAYSAIAAALGGLAEVDKDAALKMAVPLEKETNTEILNALGEVYSKAGAVDKLSFYEKHWNDLDIYATFALFENYYSLLKQSDDTTITASATKLNEFATNLDNSPWKRFGSIKVLHDLKSNYLDQGMNTKAEPIAIMLNRIKERETNEQLKAIINSRF